ncbi:GtrA family protein [Oxalobacteraceae bacterium OTU3CINTB1]|nr:GtrA family protein [Oxalobacteraceae bacterium OTU3CINTB1]
MKFRIDRAALAALAATPLLGQFLRFALVGASGTAVQYLLLWFGVERCGAGAAAASGAGYALAAVVNYVMNYFFTFGGGDGHLGAAGRYLTLLGLGWCLNTALMSLLVQGAGWHYWPAQALATGLGLLWNFAGSRWWAFLPRR